MKAERQRTSSGLTNRCPSTTRRELAELHRNLAEEKKAQLRALAASAFY
jgi:hypothetical protein